MASVVKPPGVRETAFVSASDVFQLTEVASPVAFEFPSPTHNDELEASVSESEPDVDEPDADWVAPDVSYAIANRYGEANIGIGEPAGWNIGIQMRTGASLGNSPRKRAS